MPNPLTAMDPVRLVRICQFYDWLSRMAPTVDQLDAETVFTELLNFAEEDAFDAFGAHVLPFGFVRGTELVSADNENHFCFGDRVVRVRVDLLSPEEGRVFMLRAQHAADQAEAEEYARAT